MRTWVTLSLGADFSYKLPEQFGVQARLLFYQLPPGCDPPAVPGWSWLLLCALPTEPCMDINQGLSESEPCSAWTWKYLVRNRHRHGAKQWARGSEALWKVDRNSFFFFFNDKWLRILLAYKREQEDGMAASQAQLLYTRNRRSTRSRSTHKILRPPLRDAHPGKEKCLKTFLAKTWFSVI